mmetsp:Transcript_34683/g.62457  ORF Transcript_34683/g.62457 Transcript_34683/m.62457 type:complete len:209 (-) Transcript_34683:1608-2234(-)
MAGASPGPVPANNPIPTSPAIIRLPAMEAAMGDGSRLRDSNSNNITTVSERKRSCSRPWTTMIMPRTCPITLTVAATVTAGCIPKAADSYPPPTTAPPTMAGGAVKASSPQPPPARDPASPPPSLAAQGPWNMTASSKRASPSENERNTPRIPVSPPCDAWWTSSTRPSDPKNVGPPSNGRVWSLITRMKCSTMPNCTWGRRMCCVWC